MKKRLTKLQKRMQILKDALAQIRIGFLRPERSGICGIDTTGLDESSDGKTLLLKLKKKKRPCTVCARGSLLLASVIRFNKLTVRDFDAIMDLEGSFEEGSRTDSYLMTMFTGDQLMMMETSFEGCHNKDELIPRVFDKCILFFERYESPKKRLIAILENAIKNKGTFIP